MKVQRYPLGQTNVGLLREGQSKVMSPEYAAAAEMRKYDALADVVDEGQESFVQYQELRAKALDSEDAIKTERSIAEFSAAKKRLKEQIAADPTASADDYEEGVQELIREFTNRGDLISDRNRTEYMERAGFISRVTLDDVLVESSIMRMEKSRTILAEGIEGSIEAKDWDAARMQSVMGVEQGLWDERAKDKLLYDIDARAIAEDLGEKYAEALAEGKVDEFMQEVGSMELNDATESYFGKEKQRVDLFADQVEAELRVEQSIEFNDYKANLNSESDPELVKAWIRERPWLDKGQINSIYSAMKQGEKTGGIVTSIYSDRDAKANREAANSELNLDAPPEEVAKQAASFAGKYRIVPTAFTNMVNYFAEQDEPGALIEAGKWVQMMEDSAPGISMHLHDRTMAKVQMYNDMVKRQVDEVKAATTTTNHFANITDQVVEARRSKYEVEGFGPDGMSPAAFIDEEIIRRLTDVDSPEGALFANDLGAWFDYDQYTDSDVAYDPVMQETLSDLAKNFYIAGASEEVAIQSAIRAVRDMGYAATDINEGVIWAGETEYEYQIQKNPVTRVGNSVVPKEQVRDLIYQDIKNMEFMRVSDPLGAKPRKFPISSIVVGDGIRDEKGMKWPLLVNGSQLKFPNGLPVVWRYPEEKMPKEKQEETNYEAEYEKSMRARMTGGLF